MSRETRDVSVRGIAIFAGALVAGLIVVMVVIGLVIVLLQGGAPDRTSPPPREPAGPPLRIQDMAQQRAAEEAILSSEGNGRIPIERAMDLVVGELPVRRGK
jgi:hypothetical protein